MCNTPDMISLVILPCESLLAEHFITLMYCRVGWAVPATAVKDESTFLKPFPKETDPYLGGLEWKDVLAAENGILFISYLFLKLWARQSVPQLSFQHMTEEVAIGLKGHETRPQSQRGAEDDRTLSTPPSYRGPQWVESSE